MNNWGDQDYKSFQDTLIERGETGFIVPTDIRNFFFEQQKRLRENKKSTGSFWQKKIAYLIDKKNRYIVDTAKTQSIITTVFDIKDTTNIHGPYIVYLSVFDANNPRGYRSVFCTNNDKETIANTINIGSGHIEVARIYYDIGAREFLIRALLLPNEGMLHKHELFFLLYDCILSHGYEIIQGRNITDALEDVLSINISKTRAYLSHKQQTLARYLTDATEQLLTQEMITFPADFVSYRVDKKDILEDRQKLQKIDSTKHNQGFGLNISTIMHQTMEYLVRQDQILAEIKKYSYSYLSPYLDDSLSKISDTIKEKQNDDQIICQFCLDIRRYKNISPYNYPYLRVGDIDGLAAGFFVRSDGHFKSSGYKKLFELRLQIKQSTKTK